MNTKMSMRLTGKGNPMQSIDLSALEGFTKDLDTLLKKMPDKKRELHVGLANLTKAEVDTQIEASGVSSNKIKSWQEAHVGSRGGYAAVRASNRGNGNNSPGAITQYLEGGHKIRSPSGKSKRYKPAIRKPYVDGKHFYKIARTAVESKAIDVVNQFAEDLVKELGG